MGGGRTQTKRKKLSPFRASTARDEQRTLNERSKKCSANFNTGNQFESSALEQQAQLNHQKNILTTEYIDIQNPIHERMSI